MGIQNRRNEIFVLRVTQHNPKCKGMRFWSRDLLNLVNNLSCKGVGIKNRHKNEVSPQPKPNTLREHNIMFINKINDNWSNLPNMVTIL